MTSDLRVGIIGLGVVGHALHVAFRKRGCLISTYDKFRSSDTLIDCLKTDLLFLALPTPYSAKHNGYNLEAIQEVCQYLSLHAYNGIVLLKSTVLPGTTALLANRYPALQFVHNPEFLSAATAVLDVEEQRHIVFGYHLSVSKTQRSRLREFHTTHFPHATISECDCHESEAMKLFVNAFYAVKIQFSNELWDLCRITQIDYNRVKALMVQNGWLAPYHLDVPGHDGQLSYGGACFPKDTNALRACMRVHGTRCGVLEATIKERNDMREEQALEHP